jgi:hypothetical protein
MTTMTAMSTRLATDTVKIDQCRYRPGGSRFTTAESSCIVAATDHSSCGYQLSQEVTLDRHHIAELELCRSGERGALLQAPQGKEVTFDLTLERLSGVWLDGMKEEAARR